MLNMIQKDCDEVTANSASLLSKLKGECILITGGTGFMGTWLVEIVTFLNDNYNFDTRLILLSERAQNFSAKAPHLALRKDVELIEHDVRNVVEIPDEITFIIHAASNPDSRIHASDPFKTMYVISKGTDAILNAAIRLPNLKKLLNISSGLIYGHQPLELDTISENFRGGSDCSSVASAYAEAKRFAETLCSVYRSQYKMPIVTARPFAFIGPYQLLDKPWAINNFIRDSLMGGTIRILGDGETVRSYMYPSDMAFWLLRILVDGTSGLAYNVGSPHSVTLQQLTEKIASNFPVQPKIISRVAGDGILHRSRLVPDVTLAQKNLGLTLKVDINEAIKRTLLWYREGGINRIKKR
jgi:dTDP-glucose 4,6-dehydratase